jgi:hypothetical protein
MFLALNTDQLTIFDFKTNKELSSWYVVNDDVMGGRSTADFFRSPAGHAVFEGKVSLENNGGFSSVRHRFPEKKIEGYQFISIRLKGDGKKYQFRMKTSRWDRHSYIYYFETSGEWQTIQIPLSEMKPSFRGNFLDMPNYPGEKVEEIAFLIANYKAEKFNLKLESISLE